MAIDHWRPFGAPSLSRGEPLRDLTDLQQEMSRLFDGFFGRPATSTTERMWMPLGEIYETKDDLNVTLELPGIREKDVSVSITDDVLTVKGERKWEKELEEGSYHRLERSYGKFERIVPLPVPVQADKVKATYRDGVLEIKLPKSEQVKPREIKIDVL